MCQVFNQGRVESTRDNRWRPTPSAYPLHYHPSYRPSPPPSSPSRLSRLPPLWLGVQLCRPHFRTASLLPSHCTISPRASVCLLIFLSPLELSFKQLLLFPPFLSRLSPLRVFLLFLLAPLNVILQFFAFLIRPVYPFRTLRWFLCRSGWHRVSLYSSF